MSYVHDFAGSALGNYFTPQRVMNSVIRDCAEGSSVHGSSDLHAVQHLERIVSGVKAHLNGDVPGSILEGNVQVRDMMVMELDAIKVAIDSACPIAQTKALADIISHGSLSSARLNARKFPQPEFATASATLEL